MQHGWKDRVDRRQGSKAERSYRTARHLTEAGVGTPEPIGFLENWTGHRLREAIYLSRHEDGISSFDRELIHLYRNEPFCEPLMALLQATADAVRGLHDAGVYHRDLGNQNILMRRSGPDSWTDIQFIDLNRARRFEALSLKQRASDMARIWLPSDFLRIFKEMYFGGVPPDAFQRHEQGCRNRFSWHTRSRRFRHPVREARIRREAKDASTGYPPDNELWIWDERSGQAISTMRSRERRKHFPLSHHLKTGLACLNALPSVRKHYRALSAHCFQERVDLTHRIGITVHPREETWDQEYEYLKALPKTSLWVRFHHHEDEARRCFTAKTIHALHQAGYPISIALVQDRRAVNDPEAWASFARRVLEAVHESVEWVEIGHAINRVKWGVWTYPEYNRLVDGVMALKSAFPALKFSGPSMIDFEYHFVMGALNHLSPGARFDALSHHLYVDRRGAPENCQGKYDTVAKCALARAMARTAENCEDRLIVSEVNWPLEDTGVHSPVGSPYLYPNQRLNGPSVSEDLYAAYMVRYYLQALCSGMADRVYWWRLAARGYGMVDDTNPDQWRPRPAYAFLKTFLEQLGTAEFIRRDLPGGGIQRFTFEGEGGKSVQLLYTTEEKTEFDVGDFNGDVLNARGEPVKRTGIGLQLDGTPIYLCAHE
ncbi:MAG: lipopolysaccharide kinase InaA family protein [Verrucomicrobiota bacterium]